VAWSSTNINSRGAAMFEYLFGTHLDILNRGNEPTFVNRVRTQLIDISLESSNIWHEVQNPRSTNWEFFEKDLESELRGYDTDLKGEQQSIENSVVTIQRSLAAAYEEFCHLKTADQGCRTPYWDSQIGKLRKAAKRSWNGRQSDPDAYHLAVKAYDKALRAAKRKSWRTFCSEVDGITPSARLHTVRSFKGC
jgi:hypothetical protein